MPIMPSDLNGLPVHCPLCRGAEFTREMTGFPIKTAIFRCGRCGTSLKAVPRANPPVYSIDKIGTDFSNTSEALKGCTWSAEELADQDGPSSLYSDQDLIRMAQGSIAEDLLTGDDDCAAPFHTRPGETVIFAMDNIYSWQTRPKDDQVARGLKAFQVKAGEWKDAPILGEPKRLNLLDTLDDGSLYLTNQRILFVGKNRQIDEDLARIQAVLPFQDGFGVLRKEQVRIECYKGNFYWPLVGAWLTGMATRKKRENAAREAS
jgi:hypothetical protein